MRMTRCKKWKVLVVATVLLSMCLGMFYMPNSSKVNATAIETDANGIYEVPNGDFESGRVGYSVRNWSKTAMEYSSNTKVEGDDAKKEAYLDAYILTTDAETSGNKVASLEKRGSGYVAATSEAVPVSGGQPYQMTFDYKTVEVTAKQGATNGLDYFGVRVLIEEVDAEGNSLSLTRLFTDKSNTNQWSTGIVEFVTKESTASVIIYLWVGGQWNMNATVHFDNVALESASNNHVYNGTFDKATYMADGGRSAGTAGPAGWTSISSDNGGNNLPDNNGYNKYYEAKIVDNGGDDVLCYSVNKASGKTYGYSIIQSPFIAVKEGQKYSLGYDVKIDLVRGSVNASQKAMAHITYYDAQYGVLGVFKPTAGKLAVADLDWTTKHLTESGMVTPANTAYVKIGFYAGTTRNDDVQYDLYFDNVVFEVEGELSGWMKDSCIESGIPTTNNYLDYYDIRKVSDGIEHKDALQLYVARDNGVAGGVVFYSNRIAVTSGEEYTTSFDLKIENSDSSAEINLFGASYVLRYLDEEGKILNDRERPTNLTGRLRENMDWTHYSYDFTPPENTKYVQVGLVIGGYNWNKCKELTHTWDNLVLMEKEEYNDYIKDPAVTSSELYKKSVLFVGDSSGGGMAEIASSYSEMVVTNACNESVSVEEQLSTYAAEEYQYVIVSTGVAEMNAQIPTGVVTDNSIYMSGVDFDTTTFAGLLEQIFAKVTEYHEPEKLVYILPNNTPQYRAVAELATQKWGVALVVLDNLGNSEKNWNDAIEPAEQANVFDCYNVPGLKVYLENVVDDIAGQTISLNQMPILEALLQKAEGCPKDHTEFQDYQELAQKTQTLLDRFDDYRPTMCGGTIAEGDPNQLCFLAISAKKLLTEENQVKKMGILVTPSIQGADTLDLESIYSGADTMYRAVLSGEAVEPSVVYMAKAYVVYEEDGQEYTFYSNNDYTNALGMTTAQNGVSEKSVYEIAKEIALELSAEKAEVMDFTAIGGESNQYLIPEATEDSTISLYDIYRLVSDNAVVLKEWLGERSDSR